MDERLQQRARGESDEHLGRRAEEHEALHHRGNPVLPGRPELFELDALGPYGQANGADRLHRTAAGLDLEVADAEPARSAGHRARRGIGGSDTGAHDLGVHQVRHAEEVGDVGISRLLVQDPRSADLREVSTRHDREAVGHRESLFLIVGHVQKGDADSFLDRLQLHLERAPELRVERPERLVEQQHRGMQHEGPCECDPLLLASGELVDAPLLVAGELHELEHLADALFRSPTCRATCT